MWDVDNRPDKPLAPRYKRFGAPPTPFETEAEAILAARFGWDLAIFRGEQSVNRNLDSGAYRLLAPAEILAGESPRFQKLQVLAINRFGNFVRQLRNVFFAAQTYDAKRVEFPKAHPCFSGDVADGVSIAWRLGKDTPVPGLAGQFFYPYALALTPSPAEQADVLRRYVRPLLSAQLREPDRRVEEGDIALHFRGGDIFTSDTRKWVHPRYGQPPLSYYLQAVERTGADRVWLVHEDRTNPLVDAVEAALSSRGLTAIPQSSELQEDLRLLLSVEHIVASVGTFVPAIAALSHRLRRMTSFAAPIPALSLLGVATTEVVDAPGEYRRAIMSGNWRDHPTQRALMLSYPAEALAFVDHPAG